VLVLLRQGLAAAKTDADQDRSWGDDLPECADLDDLHEGHTAVWLFPARRATTKQAVRVTPAARTRSRRKRSDRRRPR
jgi:hypothetical protein